MERKENSWTKKKGRGNNKIEKQDSRKRERKQ